MESQHTTAYEAVFQRLRELGWEPRHVVVDFETAVRNALLDAYGRQLRISGCVHHYAVCLYKSVKRLQVVDLVRENVHALKVVRWLSGTTNTNAAPKQRKGLGILS